LNTLNRWRKKADLPTSWKKQRLNSEAKLRGNKHLFFEKHASRDKDNKINETWRDFLIRICGDQLLSEVADYYNIKFSTLNNWRVEAGLYRQSKRKRKISPEDRLKRRKQKIIGYLSEDDEIKKDPIDYIKKKLEGGMKIKELFDELRKKGLKTKYIRSFERWLMLFNISYTQQNRN